MTNVSFWSSMHFGSVHYPLSHPYFASLSGTVHYPLSHRDMVYTSPVHPNSMGGLPLVLLHMSPKKSEQTYLLCHFHSLSYIYIVMQLPLLLYITLLEFHYHIAGMIFSWSVHFSMPLL